jgi:hypothetical protein
VLNLFAYSYHVDKFVAVEKMLADKDTLFYSIRQKPMYNTGISMFNGGLPACRGDTVARSVSKFSYISCRQSNPLDLSATKQTQNVGNHGPSTANNDNQTDNDSAPQTRKNKKTLTDETLLIKLFHGRQANAFYLE